jgi:hypothetical protein
VFRAGACLQEVNSLLKNGEVVLLRGNTKVLTYKRHQEKTVLKGRKGMINPYENQGEGSRRLRSTLEFVLVHTWGPQLVPSSLCLVAFPRSLVYACMLGVGVGRSINSALRRTKEKQL